MKKIIFYLLFLLSTHYFSQTEKIYSFDEVDKLPTSNRCKAKVTKEQQNKCFDMFVRMHYSTKVTPKLLNKYNLKSGMHNVLITFVINKKGKSEQVKVRMKNDKLRVKLEQIFRFLPKIKPAILDSKPVNTYYSFPFTIKI